MPLVRTTSLTLYGQPVTGLQFSALETQLVDAQMQDPLSRAAIDLTGYGKTLRFWKLDILGRPVQPPVLTVPGNIDGLVVGHCPFGPFTMATLGAGTYGMDVQLVDPSNDSFLAMPLVPVTVVGPSIIPAVPAPGQLPVPGPQGPAGPAGATGLAYVDSGAAVFTNPGTTQQLVTLAHPFASSNYKVYLFQPNVTDAGAFVSAFYQIVDGGHFTITASGPFNGSIPWGTTP